ncbi:MAG TPA: Asp-tRNA(Asn)/Glu-tRNA(Gln) amidotransferase GatCAB subunit A [Gammaproteobacteria bacterium]|nr:Asp-tRNA(Asn)/Glu-tRNA(Gln) amidotransferase GatCAB subunit A [Gammaproteobacteria bacterium]|tara:strand:- start:29 stop:1447 length:1419 start_codon:yes stop_codon:yes gene_type:complete
MTNHAFRSALDLAAAIREQRLSAANNMENLLARIETLDPTLNTVVTLNAEAALTEAHKADKAVSDGDTLGPLHGVPFGLKDIIDAAGLPTTAHSKIFAENIATEDSTVTTKLKQSGALLVGKLATHEFAFGGPSFDLPWPPARNPWDTRMFTGGSSSGSGAAVAAGFIPLALGTDTGGSVRNPASLCGIVGMKATYGRVSRRGVIPLAFSLDHVGPMTRTVADNAALLQVISGYDPRDRASAQVPVPDYLSAVERGRTQGIKGMRIGVIRHFFEKDMVADSKVVNAINASLHVLADLGANITDVETQSLQTFSNVNRIILLSEAYAVHQHWLQSRPQDYAVMTREKLLPGAFIRAVDYVQALRNRPLFTTAIDMLLDDADVLITASSMDPPFPIDDPEAVAHCYPRSARPPFNLTGHPALSLPIGFTEPDGDVPVLPLGLQVIGRHFDEESVYRVASAYEHATNWSEVHPPH